MGAAGGQDVSAGLRTARVAEPRAASAGLGCLSPPSHPASVPCSAGITAGRWVPGTPSLPGSPWLAGDFSPSSRSPWERAAEARWLGERSSCPLLYLLHLANLMTGGMRSISNMASLAGSGQSTQEAFLHTSIPAGCCRSLLPRASRCRLPRAGWDRHSQSSPSCPATDVSLCRSALGCAGGRGRASGPVVI